MRDNGESNYALAKKLGVSQSAVANWLNGDYKPLRPYALMLFHHYGERPEGLNYDIESG